MLQPLTHLDADTFAKSIEGSLLILLSPRLRNRNTMLAWFMEGSPEPYYYTLRSEDSNFRDFLKHMTESFRDYDPKFGKQTLQAVSLSTSSAEEMADAFAADLGKVKPRSKYLIIDSMDYLELTDDVYTFFSRLLKGLPRGLQIVINSRFLEYGPWVALVRSGEAVVLGDEHTLDGGIFTSKADMPQLEVYGLAGGSVYVNGLPLETWDGPLPRNLFYYFVDHPMVTRDEIFEAFWPDLPVKEATNVFHVTKRKISERLGFELTSYGGGFYKPSGQMMLHYDVARFHKTVEDNNLNLPNEPGAWYQAIQLYRSPYLHRIHMHWIVKRREELRLVYAEALIGIARLYRAIGQSDQSISYYLRALREVPQREDIHRDLMLLYTGNGEREKAVQQYRHLVEILQQSLGIPPSKSTQKVYNTIVGG